VKIAVIGGGIVGVSSANWLTKYGQEVTLYDRTDPGAEASFGNAGTYAKYANVPTNSSSFFYLFPYLLLNKNSPLFIRGKYFPKVLPWLTKYLSNCRPSKVKYTSEKLTTLLTKVDEGYEDLFKEANIEHLISRESVMYVWSSKIFYNSAIPDFITRAKTGIDIELLSHNEISEVEPNLNNIFYKGALFNGSYFSKNPKETTEGLLKLFQSKGGIFLQEEVTGINMNAADKVEIVTGKSRITYDKIIICAGVWSKKLASLIGDNVPIESERGYHISYNNYNPIKHPVAWQERGTYFTPMNNGLRVAGTVEFAGLDREINRKVINFLSRSAKQVFPEISSHDNEWLGFRPSAPDSLPVIGQSKKNPYIYYCFGHQHIGWSLGGITGKLIAQEAIANKTDIDLTPFSVGRF